MEKKQTRRESRETAFLTAFAATFEPETPLVPAETESAAPDAFATQLLAAMNDHAAELDEIITARPASAWWPCASAWLRCCMARSRRPVSPSTKLLSLSKSTELTTTTSSSTACWGPLHGSAASSLLPKPPSRNADAGHRYQQLCNLSGCV